MIALVRRVSNLAWKKVRERSYFSGIGVFPVTVRSSNYNCFQTLLAKLCLPPSIVTEGQVATYIQ